MSGLKQIPLKLSEEDRWILDRLHYRLKGSKVQLIRWALRYYALHGPWHNGSDPLPGEILTALDRVEVGPVERRVS